MKCQWCDEEILLGERSGMIQNADFHDECALRSVVGSVGHQLHVCSCFGGCLDDPPGLTKRQAARAAAVAYQELQRLHAVLTGNESDEHNNTVKNPKPTCPSVGSRVRIGKRS